MKAYPYPPTTPTQIQSAPDINDARANFTDEALKEYVPVYFQHYRATIERYFPTIAPWIPFYTNYPFHTRILRLGGFGVIIGYQPSINSEVTIMGLHDFDPPLQGLNFFDILSGWNAIAGAFDMTGERTFDAEEARIVGIKLALNDALAAFWNAVTPEMFTTFCRELLRVEGIEEFKDGGTVENHQYDFLASMHMNEPAGFWRSELWAFAFKHYSTERLSASVLRELEDRLSDESSPDILCLLTSGDLTSIGNAIAVTNPRMRVWDRATLNRLINKHLEVIAPYFSEYPEAAGNYARVIEMAQAKAISAPDRYAEFKEKLEKCPTGQADFATYERVGIEIWTYLFSPHLVPSEPQRTTKDKVQRRDVLFRNERSKKFWNRVAVKHQADFVIIDFKNDGNPITSKHVTDVEKYASKALGHFIILISRKGASSTVEAAQIRAYKDHDNAVIVVSDNLLLEMIALKNKGENAEDVLEDLLDELSYKC